MDLTEMDTPEQPLPPLAQEARIFEKNLRLWMTSLAAEIKKIQGARKDWELGMKGTVNEFLAAYEAALLTSGLGETDIAVRCIELTNNQGDSIFGGARPGVRRVTADDFEQLPLLPDEIDSSSSKVIAAGLFLETLKLRVVANKDKRLAANIAQLLKK